jgi:hypothetical protein
MTRNIPWAVLIVRGVKGGIPTSHESLALAKLPQQFSRKMWGCSNDFAFLDSPKEALLPYPSEQGSRGLDQP